MATATFKYVLNPNLGGFGDIGQRSVGYYGSIVFSAATDTYLTGGLLPAAGFALKNLGPFADRTPLYNYIQSSVGIAFFYLWNTATGKLQIFGSGAGSGTAPQTEYTTAQALNAGGAASPASDTILFQSCFPRV